LGAPTVNSKLALGGGILNLATGSTLQLAAVTGFTNLLPASYTIASLSDGANLQLDGAGVSDGFVYGAYVQGTGASGPVTIDVSAFGATLNAGDQFALSRAGNGLVLNFSTAAVPEPGLLTITGLLGIVAVGLRRR